MQRRDLLAIAAAGAALGGVEVVFAQTGGAAPRARLIRIYTKSNGDSAVEELEISPERRAHSRHAHDGRWLRRGRQAAGLA